YDFRRPSQPQIVEDANPHTFFAMDPRWAKDDRHYYYNLEKLSVAYRSFERLSPFFAKDAHQAYYFSGDLFRSFPVNVRELERLTDRYLYDDRFLYFFCDQRRGEQVRSLEKISYDSNSILLVLDEQYIRVGSSIYCDGELVEDADATQFRVINDSYAKDSQYVYWWGLKIRSADPATFHYNEEQKHYEDKRFRFFRNKAYPKAAF
ncbi:MAG: DKNYY domain-containing protein, partial [Bacteroidota bacterium]